jgi:hypothetical protein
VLVVRVSHDAPGGDARHRVHVSVPVETLSEESQVVVSELLVHTWQLRFALLRSVPPVHKSEGATKIFRENIQKQGK